MPDASEILEALGIALQRGGQAGFGAAQYQTQQKRQNLLDMLDISAQRQTQEFRRGQVGRAEEGLGLERGRLDLAKRAQVFRQFESDIGGAQKALEPGKQLTKTQLEAKLLQDAFAADPQLEQKYLNNMLEKLAKSGQPTTKRDVTTSMPLGQARTQALGDFETMRDRTLIDYAAQMGYNVKEWGLPNIERDLRSKAAPTGAPLNPDYPANMTVTDFVNRLEYFSPTNIQAMDSSMAVIQGITPQGGINPVNTLPAVRGETTDLDETIRRLEDELSREP